MYFPISQGFYFPVYTIVLRTQGEPGQAAGLLRQRIREIDPNLPAYNVQTMTHWVDNSTSQARINTWLLTSLAVAALLLGAIGIYGVISYMVAIRTQEIGVRIALGARSSDVHRLVLGQALVLALGGVFLGLAAAFTATHVLADLLFEVAPRDPVTFTVAPAVLCVSALLASYLPARRAARVDPMVALRTE
ncbi:MAG: FtsX-like permease family protein [Bryobacteraceae bacterium]